MMVSEVGTNGQRFIQLFPAAVRHHRELGREPLHVLRFLREEAHRDEEREIGILNPMLLEHVIQGRAASAPR
jgi:hypothetical protein